MKCITKEIRIQKSTDEAAATYRERKTSSFIQIGNNSYSSAKNMATVIAHEFTHARQGTADSSQSLEADEMYAYQMEISRKLGTVTVPKASDLLYYVGRMEIGTDKYYWKLPTFKEKLTYRSVLSNYILEGTNRIADYAGADYANEIKKFRSSTSTFNTGGVSTYSTSAPPQLSSQLVHSIVMHEFTTILQKTITMMAALEKSTNPPVTASNIDKIGTVFAAEFGATSWNFPSTASFGKNYEDLLEGASIGGLDLRTYIRNFYRANRNGVIDAITTDRTNAIGQMTEWVNANTKDPEKQDLLDHMSMLSGNIK